MIRKHVVNIVVLLGLAMVAGLLYTGGDDWDDPQPVTITGADIVNSPDKFRLYVDGVIAGALVTDSSVSYTCQTANKTDDEVSIGVIRKISTSTSLQNQAGNFAVLNAYGNLYCDR